MASFDILMSLYTETDEDRKVEALEIITYINCTISIMGILITVIILLTFRILRRKLFNQVLCQYLLSILAALVVFLAGIKQTQSKQRCLIVAALLHYFLNTSFFWMFAHAILAYIHYVENFVVDTPKLLIRSSLCCWGIPFVVILIIIVFTYDHKREIFKYCCWPMGNELQFYFLFSAGFVMIVNTLMFVKIVYSLFFDRSKALRINQSSVKWTAKRLGTAINLFFLLGLPWSFGFFTLEKTRLAFKYLFTLFSTLQGFVVFINVSYNTKKNSVILKFRTLMFTYLSSTLQACASLPDFLFLIKIKSDNAAQVCRVLRSSSLSRYFSGYPSVICCLTVYAERKETISKLALFLTGKPSCMLITIFLHILIFKSTEYFSGSSHVVTK